MKSLIALAAAASVAAIALPAAAQGIDLGAAPEKLGVYGELGYTGGQVHDADQGSVTGRLGYRLHPNFGVEGELNVGVSDGDRTFAAGTPQARTVGIDQKHGEAAYVVGYLPLSPRADVFARAGYGRTSYDVSPAGLPNYDADAHGFRVGAGGQYFFDGSNGVRVDYTRYEVENVDDAGGYFGGEKGANEWSVAYTHRF